jgi:alpha-1,3/alpha-1,6-mannosyltransferase/myotubularin-related protein 1/2
MVKGRVVLIHLDLGIGGAERLVINTAICLKDIGYDVSILTSHHDNNHCFEETNKDNGILGKSIHVYGDWIPRHIYGKGTAFFAIIRMLYITIILTIKSIIYKLFNNNNYVDFVFMDGVSESIPLLTLLGIPVLFYCHFPDKLLCIERKSYSKKIYRFMIDTFEEITTGISLLSSSLSLYCYCYCCLLLLLLLLLLFIIIIIIIIIIK